MKRQFSLSLFLFFFLTHPVIGNAHEQIIRDKRFVLGIDVGLAKPSQLGNTVSFPLGYSTFNYTPNGETSASLRYGISLGRKFMVNPGNNLIIGVSYHQLNEVDVEGILQQGITPPLYSATYQYTIQASQLLLDAKLQHEWRQIFYPYVSAGLGNGSNTAKNFSTTVPAYLTVTPTYSNRKNSSLSYLLGIGIDALLSPNTTLGLGYEFSDWGKVGLGIGVIRARTLSSYLTQSHLYTNTILARLNWYF